MKLLQLLFIIICCLPFSIAATTVDIMIDSKQDINSTIIQVSDTNVNTDVYCSAENCTTNVYGGQISIQNNQSFVYNDNSDYYDYSTKEGLSFSELLSRISTAAMQFISTNDISRKSSAYNLLEILDVIFVNHQEAYTMQTNIEYLASEIDMLNAKTYLLQKEVNKPFDPLELECIAGIYKADRTESIVTTKHGYIIDLETFGRTCINITSGD